MAQVKLVTGVQITLTLEEAQELQQLFYAGLGCNVLDQLKLRSLQIGIENAGISPKHPDGRFCQIALLRK